MEMDFQDAAAASGIEEIFSALSLNTSFIESPQLRASINRVFSGVASEEQLGVTSIRKILSIEANPPIQEVINTGIAPILIKMSYARPIEFTFEVCWILCNIGSGNSQHAKYLVELGSLDFFSNIFESYPYSNELRDQIVWAVGNISGDCPELRDLVNSSKIFQQILNYSYEILTKNQIKIIANCMWALSNSVRGKPAPNKLVVQVVNKCFLEALLIVSDTNTLVDIGWGLSYTTGSLDELSCFKNTHLTKLLEHVNSPKINLLVPVIRTIGNFISNASLSWGILKPLGVLETFLRLLNHPKVSVRKEIYWALSNLISESNEVVCYLLNLGAYKIIIQLIDKEDLGVIGEIIWSVANSFESADEERVKRIFEIGWCHKLLEIYKIISHAKQKIVIIKGIDNIRRKCPELLDGVLKLEILKMRNYADENDLIIKNVEKLIEALNCGPLNDLEQMEVV